MFMVKLGVSEKSLVWLLNCLLVNDDFGFSIQRNGENEEHILCMSMELKKQDLPTLKF